jgi:Glyoxalase-like domain
MSRISRRSFCLSTAGLLALPYAPWAAVARVPKNLDHIILGCNDLDAGVEYVYQKLGVRAAAGGVHPGAGTKNALLSLGNLRYLEIIAPDPLQSASTDPRDVADLKSPALVGWAIHRHDVDDFATALRVADVQTVGPKPGSRKRPDGTTLTWKSLTLQDDSNGILPFFIEWGAGSLHPSADAPQGCRLTHLEIGSPNPGSVRSLAEKLQLDVRVSRAEALQLNATIAGPKGSLALRSR